MTNDHSLGITIIIVLVCCIAIIALSSCAKHTRRELPLLTQCVKHGVQVPCVADGPKEIP